MKYFRKFGRRRIQRKRGVSKGGYKRKVSKSVKRYVKRAIHRQIENKRWSYYLASQPIFCPTSVAGPQNFNLMPAPTQGATNNQRIGDKINLRGGGVTWSATYKAYNATSNPYTKYNLTIALVRTLQHNDNQLNNTDWSEFFDAGTSYTGFQSTNLDTCFKINENRFAVYYKKTFLMGSNTFGATSNQALGNRFSEVVRGYIPLFKSKKFRHMCKFSDSDIYPTNNNLQLVCWASPLDDTASGSTTIIPISFTFSEVVYYEDA